MATEYGIHADIGVSKGTTGAGATVAYIEPKKPACNIEPKKPLEETLAANSVFFQQHNVKTA